MGCCSSAVKVRVLVSKVAVENVPKMDTFSKSDVYIKMIYKGKIFKTKVVDNVEAASFDVTWDIIIIETDLKMIKFEVWDEDTFLNDRIGNFELSSKEALRLAKGGETTKAKLELSAAAIQKTQKKMEGATIAVTLGIPGQAKKEHAAT